MKIRDRNESDVLLPGDDLDAGMSDPAIVDDRRAAKPAMSAVKKARILVLTVIVLLFAVLVAVFGTAINYDNIRRFFVKLNYNFNTEQSPDGTFDFETGESNRFAVFKGGIAVVSGGTLSIIDDRGFLLSENEIACKTPALSVSPKYVLVYDLGGTSLKVFNSFESVFSLNSDEKITYASVGEGNHLAVVSYAENYKNKITVYDTAFTKVFTVYRFDRYITAAVTSPNCKTLAAAGVAPDGAGLSGNVMLFHYGESAEYASVDVGEEIVHRLHYFRNGTLLVVTDKSLRFISADGSVKSVTDYTGKTVVSLDVTDERMAIALRSGGMTETDLYLFDASGRTVCSGVMAGGGQCAVSGGSLVCIGNSGYSVLGESGQVFYTTVDSTGLYASGKNLFLLSASDGRIITRE